MNDLFDRPLHGVAIYNPRLLSKDELIKTFVARQSQLDRLVDALRREAVAQPQHHLIVGARGMGKTTLLNRLRFSIEDDAVLSEHCLGLVFPEEQYNVGSLADFWLNCVDALADELETSGRMELLEGLDDEIARTQALAEQDDRRRQALELLSRLADRVDRRLVLLVDNLDLVLDRLQDEQWSLREVLSSEARIQVVGATSAPLEAYYRHDRAFYDFFRVHHLEGLDEEETFEVLRRLAQLTGHEQVEALLEKDPGRIKTVRLMAGGNPRTVVLLFSLLAQGAEGDVRSDIERLLDHCTPFYKHRIEALSTQAQRVLDALAMHWAPATAAELAKAMHLKVNAVSSQLDRLVKDGTVEKVTTSDSKKYRFQIAERFFNIWCLMRASRRVRRRLVWLVEFLRLMFGPEELSRRARQHLAHRGNSDALRHAEMGLALADAIEDSPLRTALETQSLQNLCADPESRRRLAELLDFQGDDVGLIDRAERMKLLAEAREMVMNATVSDTAWDAAFFWERLGGHLSLTVEQKHAIASNLQTQDAAAILAALVRGHAAVQEFFFPPELEVLTETIRSGEIDLHHLLPSQVEGAALTREFKALIPCAVAAGRQYDESIETNLLLATARDSASPIVWIEWLKNFQEFEEFPNDALAELDRFGDPTRWGPAALTSLGNALCDVHAIEKAEDTYRAALSTSPGHAPAWLGLGALLFNLERFSEAESALRTATELEPRRPQIWYNLGLILDRSKKFSEAEGAYRRSVELDPSQYQAWNNLGVILGQDVQRLEEAESAYRNALSAAPNNARMRTNLGGLLERDHHRYLEAEAEYRKAIASDAEYVLGWRGLASVLSALDRYPESARAWRRAAELSPEDPVIWNNLAWSIYLCREDLDEAVSAARKSIALLDTPLHHHTLAPILVARGEWTEAEPHARRFIGASESYLETHWPDVLRFFAEVVEHGFIPEARNLLAELGRSARWEPLDRALELLEHDTLESIDRLAPEMRDAVRLVLAKIAPNRLDEET